MKKNSEKNEKKVSEEKVSEKKEVNNDVKKLEKRDAAIVQSLMKKALTYRYLEEKFNVSKKEVEKIVNQVPDYEVFHTVNEYNEPVILFRRVSKKELVFKPRSWKYLVTEKPEDGPYLLVELKELHEKYKIVPLADLHYGSQEVDEPAIDKFIDWVKSNNNVYVPILGDLIEMAGKTSIADSVYRQKIHPMDQIDYIIEKLAPIQHRLLCYVRGNHEKRAVKDLGLDPAKIIADRLKIPYFSEPAYVDIKIPQVDIPFRFFLWHGRSSGRTAGGRLNAAMDPITFTDFTHFYISAHVHDETEKEKIRIVRDSVNHCLVLKRQYVIICPSYLKYFGTYGSEGGYSPPSRGTIVCTLHANGDYRVRS